MYPHLSKPAILNAQQQKDPDVVTDFKMLPKQQQIDLVQVAFELHGALSQYKLELFSMGQNSHFVTDLMQKISTNPDAKKKATVVLLDRV